VESKIKQRIIGIIVLIAIIIIILPFVFHKSRSLPTINLAAKIPPEPAAPKVQIQLPEGISTNAVKSKAVPKLVVIKSAPKPIKPIAKPTPKPIKPIVKPVSTLQPKLIQKPKPIQKSKPVIKKAASFPLQNIVINHPKAWVIQVGTFSDAANAKRLLVALHKAGYDTYIQPFYAQNGKNFTKVFVGPNISHKKIETIQQILKLKYHISGVVTHYQPLQTQFLKARK